MVKPANNPKPSRAYMYTPAVKSERASDRILNELARKYMPTPVISHASSTAPTLAPAAMFWGRL